MTNAAAGSDQPPKLKIDAAGRAETGSLADVLEWFLNYDERTARIRHPHSEELFQWKQQDDKVNGVNIYPFDNAEARLAIGAFQALENNPTAESLHGWVSGLLETIHESRGLRTEISQTYGLGADDPETSPVNQSVHLPSNAEKRAFLTSWWLEILCTAEARFLGWVYQELYGKPFAA